MKSTLRTVPWWHRRVGLARPMARRPSLPGTAGPATVRGASEGVPLNKADLVAEVARRTGGSRAEVADVVDAVLDVIRETVVRGERVTLSGFGSFQRRRRNRRLARNPRRPEVEVVVPPRDVPSFLPGKAFREQVLATRRRRAGR